MDSFSSSNAAFSSINLSYTSSLSYKYSADLTIVSNISSSNSSSTIGIDFSNSYKSLSIEAQEIINAINEHLKTSLPEGVQSLTAEESTSEATANRIVSAVTGLFANYQKANSNLGTEEMLNKFMSAVKSGVDKGYQDAFEILDGLGAFKYDGVQSDIEKTIELVHEKLDSFEIEMRKQLGLDSTEEDTASEKTYNNLLSQVGGILSNKSTISSYC